jgi:hypothetical protein
MKTLTELLSKLTAEDRAELLQMFTAAKPTLPATITEPSNERLTTVMLKKSNRKGTPL